MQSAAEAIGLKAKLESVSAANYINFFIDPEARKNVDGFFTINYGDYADPAALLSTLVLKEGSQNYAGYDNPAVITTAMEAARSEAGRREARAARRRRRRQMITEDVAWIPMAAPDTVLVMNKAITGAPASFVYMFGPWLAVARRRRVAAEAIGLLRFILKRLVTLVLTLLVSSFVIYSSLYLAPGNPIATLTGGRTPSPEAIAILEHRYHLDQPFLVRYWLWLKAALTGDFGVSIPHRQEVSDLIIGAGHGHARRWCCTRRS